MAVFSDHFECVCSRKKLLFWRF